MEKRGRRSQASLMHKLIAVLFALCIMAMPITALAADTDIGDAGNDPEVVTATAAEPADTKTVQLTAQKAGQFLFVPKLDQQVTSDLSDIYGFTGEETYTDGTTVSLLDILIRAHELAYGESFTPETVGSYLETAINTSGKVVVSRMFEKEGNYYNFDFAVNGRLPGQEYPCGQNIDFYPINSIHPIDGDVIEFFVEQSGAKDEYAWIEKGGRYVSELTIQQNKETTVKIKGIKYFVQANRYGDADRMKEDGELLPHVGLATVDLETGAITPIEGSVTDENGVSKITMPEKGKYYVVIIPDGTEEAPTLITTLTALTVTDAPDPEVKAPEQITIVPDAKKIVKHTYTGYSGETTVEYFMCTEKNGTKLQLKAVDQDGNETPVSWTGTSANYIKFADSTEGVATVTNTTSYSSTVTITAASMIDGCDVKGTYKFTVLPGIGVRTGYSGNYTDETDITFTMDPETGRFGKAQPGDPSVAAGSDYLSNSIAQIKVADEEVASAALNYSSLAITPLKPGKTTVTVCDQYDDQNCATINVNVKGVMVKAGEDVRDTTTYVGGTKQLSYESENYTDNITWQSADENIATVDVKGLVTGVAKGSVKIYALKDGEKAGMINVGVLPDENSVAVRGLVIKSPSDFYTSDTYDYSARLQSTTGYDDDYTGPSGNLYSISGYWVDPYGTIDENYYVKSSTTKMTFFPLFGSNVKVEAYLDGKLVASGESAKDMAVNLHTLKNEVEVRAISAADPKITNSYKFNVYRERSETATMNIMTVVPADRELSTAMKFADSDEGTLFIMDESWEYRKPSWGSGYSTVSTYSGIGTNERVRAHVFADVKDFAVDIKATDEEGAHIRYAIDGTEDYTDGVGTLRTEKLSFKQGSDVVRLKVQSISDKAFAEAETGQDPWENTGVKTYWLEVKQVPVAPEDLGLKKFEISSEGCMMMTPGFSEDNPVLSAIVPVNVDNVDIQAVPYNGDTEVYCATGTYSLYNDTNKLTAAEDGAYTVNIKPTSSYGNDRYLAVAKDVDGMRASAVYSIKLEKVTESNDTKGLPDEVADFVSVGAANTNKDDSGNSGLFPEKTIKSTGALAAKLGLGSFGGYVTYYYKDGIKNDPKNAYGIDFTVFARSVSDSSTGASSVLVSKDGEQWYELAGSEHYDSDTVWDYEVKYTDEDGIAVFTDSLERSDSTGFAFPKAGNYPKYKGDMTFKGTLLLGANGRNYASVDSSAMPYAWGYVGARKADSIKSGESYAEHTGNPYIENSDGYGDGFDISWAVDKNGAPVSLDEVHYVKISSGSMIRSSAADRSGQGRVAFMVADDGQEEPVGVTAAPKTVKVADQTIDITADQSLYEVSVNSETFDVAVEADETDNVYINNSRGATRQYDEDKAFDFDKGMIRVIVQNGGSEPSINYIHVEKEEPSVSEALKNAEDLLKDAQDAAIEAEALKLEAQEAAKKPGKAAVAAAEKAEAAARTAAEKAEAAEKAAQEAKAAAETAGKTVALKKAENLEQTAKAAKTAADTALEEATAAVNDAKAQSSALAKKYTPAKVKIKKAKAAKGKKINVTWKTIKTKTTGYQVRVINKKTGKVVKTIKVKQTKKLAKKKTISKKTKKLKKGTYKVSVRAYNTVGGETYYGPWSKAKTTRVK